MSRREHLSLDEFATAPRKQVAAGGVNLRPQDSATRSPEPPSSKPEVEVDMRLEARRALRRVKRERVKGESFFVNVSLDRQTKRRLKLASFNAETSMQAIIEAAIVKYLDEIGA
ncbi:hypothetical protein EOA32_28615 [Mesorhizobium sp. M1A.F.Ca.ET.072.01.1.1]|uniref:hypothetical protein n=1 Tax=Mesorhizobium sp. M1A.F.Ca.ET.072.01.1.1 TaxID=2496753 RepID=UPI000FD5C559|nr:hypothetical protein [Mesorhizobium sp. M1A.F.Ca.ET.072.01.1.1]RUW47509.1 hypothetical protein EOA32_28615 [Mesorhizobium sp. M1A.F.Ca.ET.072.01.1.1]TIU96267.1 MAG: hypothetical protein E5W04_28905 [Mesorhizobium sp.]